VHATPATVEPAVWDLVFLRHGDEVTGPSSNRYAWWHRTSLEGQDPGPTWCDRYEVILFLLLLRRSKGDASMCHCRVGPAGGRHTCACNGGPLPMLSKQVEVLNDLSASVVFLFLYRFFGLALLNLVFHIFIRALSINSTARLKTLAILVFQQWHALSHDIARFDVRLMLANEPG